MKNVLSYGGGVNSSALFFYLLEKQMPLDIVIFADTGEESTETYDAVNRMKRICEGKNISFVIVSSKYGNLYDYYYSKKAVMSLMKRDCTSKFKISPIRQYLRQIYGKQERFTMYIGICWDEATRVRTSDVKYMDLNYPFVDDKITRLGNLEILEANKFKAVKSGCKGCMYNKRTNWIKMLVEDHVEFERHLKLEENNKRFPQILLNGQYSLRSLKNAFDKQESLTKFEVTPEANCKVSGSCFL